MWLARVAVGMEINQRNIRVVKLKRGRKGPMLDGMGKVPLPEGVITREGVGEPEALPQMVLDALNAAEAGKVNVCLSVASEGTDVRQMELPLMPEKDLIQAIRWELKTLVRFDVEKETDILVDYHEVAGGGNGPGRTQLVVSAPRRLVYGYLTPLKRIHCYPEIFDIGGFSLPWACPRRGGVGHLFLGPEMVHLSLYRDEMFQLSRQIPFAMGSMLDLPPSGDEETSALDAGLIAEGGEIGPVGKAVRELSNLVIQTLEYYRAQEEAQDMAGLVDTLVVSGEGSLVDGIVPLLENESGLRTILADPVIGPGDEGVLGDEASAYAVAVGLAQRGLIEL